METLKLNFTKKAVAKLEKPATGTLTYHDTQKKGLKLLVRPSGTKTFFLYRKIQGKPECITIGRFPEVTIEHARKQIDILNAKIANGINPNEEKRTIRKEITLSEEPNETARDYILMSLLTGARRANVLAMRWEQVNIDPVRDAMDKATKAMFAASRNGVGEIINIDDN